MAGQIRPDGLLKKEDMNMGVKEVGCQSGRS